MVDIVIIAVVGTLIVVTTILCLRSTGEQMEECWRSLEAHPGQLVRITVETGEDPVTIYIVEAESLDRWEWDSGEPPENIGVYDIPANASGTIELRLPDSDEDLNWGFMFYSDGPRDVYINYTQTRPIVMSHIFDTYFLPMTLAVLLVISLGANHLGRRAMRKYSPR